MRGIDIDRGKMERYYQKGLYGSQHRGEASQNQTVRTKALQYVPTGCPNILARSSGSTSSYTWSTEPYNFIPKDLGGG